MFTYRIVFRARRIGALGIEQQWIREVEAETPEAAIIKLYDEFEHLRVISIINTNTNLVEYA
jgi:hypothetical protein